MKGGVSFVPQKCQRCHGMGRVYESPGGVNVFVCSRCAGSGTDPEHAGPCGECGDDQPGRVPGIPSPGRKDDAGKLRYDLVDDAAEEALVSVLTFGAQKYSPGGWRHVPDAQARYFAALRRHLRAHRRGEKVDPESGLPHLAHAACCLHFMLALALEEEKDWPA